MLRKIDLIRLSLELRLPTHGTVVNLRDRLRVYLNAHSAALFRNPRYRSLYPKIRRPLPALALPTPDSPPTSPSKSPTPSTHSSDSWQGIPEDPHRHVVDHAPLVQPPVPPLLVHPPLAHLPPVHPPLIHPLPIHPPPPIAPLAQAPHFYPPPSPSIPGSEPDPLALGDQAAEPRKSFLFIHSHSTIPMYMHLPLFPISPLYCGYIFMLVFSFLSSILLSLPIFIMKSDLGASYDYEFLSGLSFPSPFLFSDYFII